MKKNQIVGAALYQYIIIIALIALGVFIVYSLMGDLIKISLTLYNNQYNDMNKQIEFNNSSNLKAGDLGGTPTKPVTDCLGSTCIIDYGDYILTGVPTNYDDYIQSSGSSGGTDATSALFDQIADQLKEKGDTQGYADFKELANLGHFQAQYQKQLENAVTVCQSKANPIDCAGQKMYNLANMNLSTPSNLSSVLTDFNEVISSYTKDYDPLPRDNFETMYINLGRARHYYFPEGSTCDSMCKQSPSIATLAKLDQIMANPKYSDNLKNITAVLMKNNDNISYKQSLLSWSLVATAPSTNLTSNVKKYDIFTGEEMSSEDPQNMPDLNDFLHPQISLGTNLNSALVCVAGKNLEDGRACY